MLLAEMKLRSQKLRKLLSSMGFGEAETTRKLVVPLERMRGWEHTEFTIQQRKLHEQSP